MVAADAPAVADLSGQLGYPATASDIAERLANLQAEPDRVGVLVAEAGQRVVGWAHVELRDTLVAPHAAQLMALVVGDGHRDRGIGRDLLRAAEAWATERGCHTLMVATRVTREDAHRFYRREGYVLDKTSHVFEKGLEPYTPPQRGHS